MKKRLLLGVVALTLPLTNCAQPAASPTPTSEPGQATPAIPLAQELKVQADDVTLYARIAGNAEPGDVLIALHGGPGNSSDYMVSLEQLASAEFAVVTYDQRGTGQSTEPSEGYAMHSYMADLEAVRQAVAAETVHLLGHSWGGLVALRYAAAHPQRVRSIILMGSGVLTPEAAQAGQANKAQRIVALQDQGVIPRTITALADLLPAYFSDPSFEMPDELKNMHYTPAVEQMTWAALDSYDFADGLGELDQPVLVLWGDDDPFGMAYLEATRDALPAARVEVVVLEGCGHYWHECPDQFFSHVRAFLELAPAP
jgi:pimeloyl-ACP methyl ester carboxylesterase